MVGKEGDNIPEDMQWERHKLDFHSAWWLVHRNLGTQTLGGTLVEDRGETLDRGHFQSCFGFQFEEIVALCRWEHRLLATFLG